MADTPQYRFEFREDIFNPAVDELRKRHKNCITQMSAFDLDRTAISDNFKRRLSLRCDVNRPTRPCPPMEPPSTGIIQLIVPPQERVLWKAFHDSWHFFNLHRGDAEIHFYLHDQQRNSPDKSRWQLSMVPLHDWGRHKRDVTFEYFAKIDD